MRESYRVMEIGYMSIPMVMFGSPAVLYLNGGLITTADGFVESLRGVVQQHRLTTKEVQKLFEGSYEGKRQAQVRMKIEGTKTNAMNFLNGLQNFSGNYGVTKLIIAPVTISDFGANQVKIVLDFLVSFG